ncbi:MAG: hypothetical protein SFU56_10700 [Capsulimonadales bacterium]|nr:hypothetical protein [Capsulimonadales bacterium]
MALPVPRAETAIPVHRPTFVGLTVVFGVTAILLFVIGIRLQQRGRWLPELPTEIGSWIGARKDVPRIALEALGNPLSRGVEFSNVFEERVQAQVFATSDFESYLDPKVFMARYRYGLTAQREIPLFGKDGGVRGLVFRGVEGNDRVLMYYWVQYRDGRTSATESLTQKEDLLTRVRLGAEATLRGTENCVVRVWVSILPNDRNGVQSRRNMDEVCRAIHDSLKEQGRKGTGS